MPRYEYVCPHCKWREELERPMEDAKLLPPCPMCTTPKLPVFMDRVYTPFWTQPSRVQR